ncbi:MAG: 4-hydroxythreonine-4-phosphate dehydrogenase PdxA [Candidatus Omnitrophica bacterium]|nr:4-hydroxythreonine-4-phosphate dehydrogenase PdxA [Candidatus Omnitrophota bacterium]
MHISPINKPQIFITMGDPSGIGPEIVLKSLDKPDIWDLAIFVVIGDGRVFKETASLTGFKKCLAVQDVDQTSEGKVFLHEGALNILDPVSFVGDFEPGKPTSLGSKKALACLKNAVQFMKGLPETEKKALVTAPLSKEYIAEIFPGFVGHTEYLRDAYLSEFVTMVMVGDMFSVVPITRHIPLKDVAKNINKQIIKRTLLQVLENRRLISGKENPVIGVCALNPHSGEGGKIGHEEIDIIEPAVEESKKFYDNLMGPVSADTIFYYAYKKQVDIVVSMYHDQCLPPFKMVNFDRGVNLTLGLGAIRTSPDHGTAFGIAGKNIANSESMEQAIKVALRAM